ncbi:MAG: UDP-N-acetylmuramoyl-L-alanine--D-glutamate ligase [Flavobacteriaceae bacterium]|nr:UDP-N-acetylmuramoyl-L-alanine--D-glutamate ligase [Flavobacteriaceae bacterium]|tara:strand:- start:7206 stop:8540 length:1335 start_codon:yes stop_codon:yes gene_type:complete
MGKILVLGAGVSGIGAIQLAIKHGFNVFVSDSGEINEAVKIKFKSWGIIWEENVNNSNFLEGLDWIIKSPGISPNSLSVINGIKMGIPIISEIEFASRYTNAKIIGVTGSNGKTTTAQLTYEIIKNAGLNVGIAGNIGKSFAKQVAEESFDIYVLELSSFQLENIINFAPDIAVITNITPDHLDRYNGNFQDYIKAKLNITLMQNEKQFLLFNSEDTVLGNAIINNPTKAIKHPFGFKIKGSSKTTFKEKKIIIEHNNSKTMISTTSFPLKGRHNLLNAMAASTVGSLFNLSKDSVRESLSNFKGLPHRLEHVLKIQDVNYINDSKATNVNATYYALQTINTPTIWIAGGVDKGNKYGQILPLVREKVKAIICLGGDNSKLIEFFYKVTDVMVETQSMLEAVKIANKIAKRRETVLLSPACSSFDLFENFEDRGNQFKKAVRNL